MIVAMPIGYTFKPGGGLPDVTPEGVEVTADQALQIAAKVALAFPKGNVTLQNTAQVGARPSGEVRTDVGSRTDVHGIKDTGSLVRKQAGATIDGGRGVNIYDATGEFLGRITIEDGSVVVLGDAPIRQ